MNEHLTNRKNKNKKQFYKCKNTIALKLGKCCFIIYTFCALLHSVVHKVKIHKKENLNNKPCLKILFIFFCCCCLCLLKTSLQVSSSLSPQRKKHFFANPLKNIFTIFTFCATTNRDVEILNQQTTTVNIRYTIF